MNGRRVQSLRQLVKVAILLVRTRHVHQERVGVKVLAGTHVYGREHVHVARGWWHRCTSPAANPCGGFCGGYNRIQRRGIDAQTLGERLDVASQLIHVVVDLRCSLVGPLKSVIFLLERERFWIWRASKKRERRGAL
jgi:hypothetical protein